MIYKVLTRFTVLSTNRFAARCLLNKNSAPTTRLDTGHVIDRGDDRFIAVVHQHADVFAVAVGHGQIGPVVGEGTQLTGSGNVYRSHPLSF